MSLTQSARAGIRDALGVVKLIAGLVLLVALSWEIIAGDHVHVSRTYLAIQFVVCLVSCAISSSAGPLPNVRAVFSGATCRSCCFPYPT